jgi:siroheme synthase
MLRALQVAQAVEEQRDPPEDQAQVERATCPQRHHLKETLELHTQEAVLALLEPPAVLE